MAANLDMECAKLGSNLSQQSDDKTLTDALSVLEEQGVYAFFLYLKQKSERRRIIGPCKSFLGAQLPGAFDSSNDVLQAIQNLARDLDSLVLARDLLRQALIYGRYHAKARASSGGDE